MTAQPQLCPHSFCYKTVTLCWFIIAGVFFSPFLAPAFSSHIQLPLHTFVVLHSPFFLYCHKDLCRMQIHLNSSPPPPSCTYVHLAFFAGRESPTFTDSWILCESVTKCTQADHISLSLFFYLCIFSHNSPLNAYKWGREVHWLHRVLLWAWVINYPQVFSWTMHLKKGLSKFSP